MIRLALYSALSDRASDGKVVVVDDWSFPAPRTKDAVAALAALELTGRILVVLGPDDGIPDRSFANLREVQTMQSTELNAYDVLKSDFVVFSDATLPGETTPAPAKAGAPRKARPAPQSKAAVTDEAVTAVADQGSGTDEDGSDR
jgi:large subunit ribosomal protein L4